MLVLNNLHYITLTKGFCNNENKSIIVSIGRVNDHLVHLVDTSHFKNIKSNL